MNYSIFIKIYKKYEYFSCFLLTHELFSCYTKTKGGVKVMPDKFTLRELRARKKATQKEVAAAMGISTQTYNAWEKDVSRVSVSKVQALASYFGVEIGQIFFEPIHE